MENKKRIYYIAGAIVIALVVGMLLQGSRFYSNERVINLPNEAHAQNQSDRSKDNAYDEVEEEGPSIFIHITGAVQNPGVYRLQEGSRMEDALQLAYPMEEADIEVLNRASLLIDGQKVIVPLRQDSAVEAHLVLASHNNNNSQGSAITASGLVNINRAESRDLEQLPGIGPALAQKIIDHRTTQGPFRKVEDLQNVAGIGAKKYADLRDKIAVVD
ncbi:helix-hairpin-helix domain-containing protein [Heliorestis convoluta]|uniref:ComEA family DNA-binding protein n=1 Tax=Heliorestis convoluta TaxID=356322 RepID=A0A5Q2N2W1_9FIRM|nr:helix-hairpin-helix domain-containing protein [Heliorestis convoluta]QGG47926.1 ComEA family DNA-binding protein [Heliorestis convoluta]